MYRHRKKTVSVCLFLFFGFAVLAYLFPYTGDDWAWGSSIGIDRLRIFFKDYNGRYAGNLLVLLLTRSKLLDALVMSFSFTLLCFLSHQYAKSSTNSTLLFSALLLLLMPKDMLAQSVVWTSGFANYVPSALIPMAYLVFTRESADQNVYENTLTWKHGTGMFVLGFVGTLFVEHVAIFNICIAVAVNLFVFLKTRKGNYAHSGFLIGVLAGALTMFSNGAYSKVAQGTDYYRNTPKGLEETVHFALAQGETLSSCIIFNNLTFCMTVSALLVVLAILRIITRKNRLMGLPLVAVNILCFRMLQHRDDIWPRAERWFGLSPQTTYVVPIVLALLYVLSIVFVILYFVEPERRLKMLLPLVCVLFSLAPLLVANPIGARCTFLAYAFMIVFTADLFGYICGHIPVLKKPISGILVVTVLVQLLMFLRIFYPIHYYDSLRLDFVREQATEGKTTVLICDLPNSEYLWNSSPSYGNLIERYKRFHKLPENLEFEFIPFNELEQIANREPK